MGAVLDKAADTAGGALTGGIKGALWGIGVAAVIGAAVVGGGAALLVAGGAALFEGASVGGAALVAGGIGAAVGAVGGAIAGAGSLGTFGAAVGGLWGGGKGLIKERAPEKGSSLDQQLEAERARSQQLDAISTQLAARQQAASSYDNPAAKGGFEQKLQQAAQQQPMQDQPAMGGDVPPAGATPEVKPSFVARTQQQTANDGLAQRTA